MYNLSQLSNLITNETCMYINTFTNIEYKHVYKYINFLKISIVKLDPKFLKIEEI
jgi:hypothetical protein